LKIHIPSWRLFIVTIDTLAGLRKAGAFRFNMPRELGGAELSLRATLELLVVC
jgi:hypothetical protein